MEGLRSPCVSQWLLAAGGPTGAKGEGGAPWQASAVLRLRALNGTPHGGFSPISVWRRANHTVAAAVRRQPSPFSSFPLAENPKKAEATTIEMSEAEVQTATTEEAVEVGSEVTLVEEVASNESAQAGEEAKSVEVETQSTSETLPLSDAETESETQSTSETLPLSGAETESVQASDMTSWVPDVSTVRVRLVLQKQCKFGEQFLVVGEDPLLGSWDPAKAIPLTWSKGDVWVADDVEFPAGKEVKYKFILRQNSPYIEWQPGPNRVLQTGETTDTIVVTGDWESAAVETIDEGLEANDDKQAAVIGGEQEKTVEAVKGTEASGDAVLIPGLASEPASSVIEAAVASSAVASEVVGVAA